MEKNEIYQTLSLWKDELGKRTKVKILPDEGKITVGRKTVARIAWSIFMLFLLLGSIYVLLYADLSNYGFISIILFIIGIGFVIYELFNINRTIVIDFEKQLFMVKYFSIVLHVHHFDDFENVIHETQIVNGQYAGVKLKIKFNDNSCYEVAYFKKQEESNALNVVFNLVKQYGLTHDIDKVNPFVDKMRELTDEELITAIRNRDDYNREKQEAIKQIGLERNLIDDNWKIINGNDL